MLPGYRIKISSDSVNERCISLTAINVLDLVEYFTKTLSSEWVKDTKVENFDVKALLYRSRGFYFLHSSFLNRG